MLTGENGITQNAQDAKIKQTPRVLKKKWNW